MLRCFTVPCVCLWYKILHFNTSFLKLIVDIFLGSLTILDGFWIFKYSLVCFAKLVLWFLNSLFNLLNISLVRPFKSVASHSPNFFGLCFSLNPRPGNIDNAFFHVILFTHASHSQIVCFSCSFPSLSQFSVENVSNKIFFLSGICLPKLFRFLTIFLKLLVNWWYFTMPWLPPRNVSVNNSYCAFKVSHWLCLRFPYAVLGIF